MKKISALAIVALLGACDPYEDEPGGTPVVTEVMVVPSAAAVGTVVDDDGSDGWLVEDVVASATAGRMIVVKTNVLLDGESIEAEPQTCIPTGATAGDPTSNGWLTVTTDATLPAGGRWYTCYNPGTPTALEGASIIIYYSTTPPGVLAAAAPRSAGRLTAGTYSFTGQVTTKNGQTLDIDFGVEAVAPAPAVVAE